ncbi:acetate--CoA ligase family protein [Pseudonocardia nantongensis]|uniref:acetate--CoA ligase family protein n=1 Tax=Pseudonocardia nantongensis TaxID=1181885 RepID=UPI00397D50E4
MTSTSPAITPERLESLFRPRSVALVGAADKSAFSRLAYDNLVEFGFTDRTFLVNRRGAPTHGRPTVTSCAEIGEPVDVAFLMVPQAGMPEALSDAAAAGIRNAVVLSSGYAEAGEAGRAAQDELVAHALSLDMVLLGPNQLGFANITAQVPITCVPGLPRTPGPVALLSQSGASSGAMVEFAGAAGIGLSLMVTLGNEAMVTAGHVLDFLVDDDATRAVAIFAETVRDPDAFRRAARRAGDAGKAVVVLKAGSSALAARTAAAHTGALVGDDAVIDAVFADLGIIRVDCIEDMLITAGATAHMGRLQRPGIGVVSISGGACDIVADRAKDVGMELPELAAETRDAVVAVMPDYGTVQNPLDVTGAAILDPSVFTRTIAAVSADPSVGAVAVVNSLPWTGEGPYSGQVFVDAIGAGIAQAGCPVAYVNQVLAPITDRTREVLSAGGVPYAIPGLRQAVVALRNVAWWSQASRLTAGPSAVDVPERSACRGAWSEPAARRLLAAAGVPVVPGELVGTADEAVAAASRIGGPVACKLVSPDVLHKSGVGGVVLGVQGDDAVRAAHSAVTLAAAAVPGARVTGVLVSPMRRGGTELLVGVVRDPQWGPILAVAFGGALVEVLGDSVLSPLPVSPERAAAMLRRLRGAAVLDGVRGAAPVDVDAVAAVVARVGDLALALGDELESLEINPLRVDGSAVEALDAVVTWRDAS